jgi:hypothetical protein
MPDCCTFHWVNGYTPHIGRGNGFTANTATPFFTENGDSITTFVRSTARARVQLHQEYHRGEDIDTLPTHCILAHILPSPVGTILRQNTGPPFATITVEEKTFWEYLRLLGRDWMWENIHEGDIDVE